MQTERPGSLKNKFESLGAAPSDTLWNAIEGSLDKGATKRRVGIWWWLGGLAASIVMTGIFLTGYFLGLNQHDADLTRKMKTDSFSTGFIAQRGSFVERQNHINLASEQSSNELTNTHSGSTDQDAYRPSNNNHLGQNNKIGWSQLSDSDRSLPAVISSEEPLAMNEMTHLLNANINRLPGATLSSPVMHLKPAVKDIIPAPPVTVQNEISKYEFGFSVASFSDLSFGNQKLMTDNNNSLTADQNGTTEELINGFSALQSGSDPEFEAQVFRPVSLNFHVGIKLGRRFSFSSGLGLGLLTAKNSYSFPVQTLVKTRYVVASVPLWLDFDYLSRPKFEASIGIGIVNELPFMFRSQANEMTPVEMKTITSGNTSGYLGAIGIRSGFAFRLGDRLKLNFNPTYHYYVRQSIQSTNPVIKRNHWLGLAAGLTWEF